jgi:hypothetical protein
VVSLEVPDVLELPLDISELPEVLDGELDELGVLAPDDVPESLGIVEPLELTEPPETPDAEPELESVAPVPELVLPVDCLSLIAPHAASDAVHATRASHLDIDIKFSLKIIDAGMTPRRHCAYPRLHTAVK